ncbi:hypothetical protein C5E11_02930 [Clavibacter michiganensis]|nr:hypothetical protein [Clavibacter michiganensis]PPF65097.1 hypothetical protein C5E11_02930 [Clavibacter michiganensis]
MPEDPIDFANDDENGESLDQNSIENDRDDLTDFVGGLSPDDIRSGNWFEKLCARAFSSYTTKATWQYFQERYEGAPADVVVDQRIKLAARYAMLEGGLSAGAYTAAVAATIGTLGGASSLTVPAAVATLMVDLALLTQLQLRLAYDIAILYRLPLDMSDPEDLWKLIRVAFTIKGGELAREGVAKTLPPLVRQIVKKLYSGPVLNAARSLPIVGKYLLQRTVIKIAIPAVGVPVAVLVNRYTTLGAGKHARRVFRNESRVIELARRLTERSQHPQLLLWVAWLVIDADNKIADDEAMLFKHLVKMIRDHHQVADEDLARVIEVEPGEVWRRIAVESGDLSDILDAAKLVAEVDGAANGRERAIIAEIETRCAPA